MQVSATQLVSLELLTMAVETLPQSTHPSSPSYIEPLLHLLTSEWILGVRALDKFEASFVELVFCSFLRLIIGIVVAVIEINIVVIVVYRTVPRSCMS